MLEMIHSQDFNLRLDLPIGNWFIGPLGARSFLDGFGTCLQKQIHVFSQKYLADRRS